jgi:glycosyltransferase involved in cell wall biosynthesis
MRIYFYHKSFTDGTIDQCDGVTLAVHGLAAALASHGITVTVLSEGPKPLRYKTSAGYIHHRFSHPTTSPSRKISPVLQTFIAQEVTAADLFILNGGFHLSVYVLSRLLKSRGIPYVMAPHLVYGSAMFTQSPHLKYPYWHLCETAVLRDAIAVQVLDQRQADGLRQLGIDRPVITVPNGVELPDRPGDDHVGMSHRLPNSLNSQWSTDHAVPAQVLFLGRLSAYIKGLDLLIDAFAGLVSPLRSTNPQLTLQGDEVGDRPKLQRQIARFGLDAQVTFQPADYHTPSAELMSAYDIVCLPSRSEGFGLVILEAMLAQRVVLVTEDAGIAPYVEASGCGVVVKPDYLSIQSGFRWLLTCRSEWAMMGQRGRDYALEHLDWTKIAAQARSDYEGLMTTGLPSRTSAMGPRLMTVRR